MPIVNDLVLVGGGHTHVHVLKSFGLRPVPGLRITLISRDVHTPYSGMLPGFIAGHYRREQCHIDLGALARFAGARFVQDEATGIDLVSKHVTCLRSPTVPYGTASLDIGSVPNLRAVPGAAEHATPVKPIDGLAARLEKIIARAAGGQAGLRFVTVGGGAAGVEVTLSMRHRLRGLLRQGGDDPDTMSFALVTRGALLPTHNVSVRTRFRTLLAQRRVALVEHNAATRVEDGAVLCANGDRIGFDELIWVTQAGAAAWLGGTGLALDGGGFVKVDATLRSVSDPNVFAAGDVAANIDHPRPKAGVFAVRQGPPLAENLRRAVAGKPPLPFRPQTQFLSLIGTGDGCAVASRGRWAAQGRAIWQLKDWIDRRWMRQYQALPAHRANASIDS